MFLTLTCSVGGIDHGLNNPATCVDKPKMINDICPVLIFCAC